MCIFITVNTHKTADSNSKDGSDPEVSLLLVHLNHNLTLAQTKANTLYTLVPKLYTVSTKMCQRLSDFVPQIPYWDSPQTDPTEDPLTSLPSNNSKYATVVNCDITRSAEVSQRKGHSCCQNVTKI